MKSTPICAVAIASSLLAWLPATATAQAASAKEVAPRWTFTPPKEAAAASGVFSRDGQFLVVAWDKGDLAALDPKTGKTAFILSTGCNPTSLAFSQDGKTLVMAESDKTVTLWNWPARKKIGVMNGFNQPVQFLFYTPDDHLLALAASHPGGNVRKAELWDITAKKNLKKWDTGARGADLAGDGKTLAIADKWVVAWSIVQNAQTFKYERDRKLDVHIHKVRFAPDGLTVALGNSDGRVEILDNRTWKRSGFFQAAKGTIASMAFTPDSKALVTAGADGATSLWDLDNPGAVEPIALTGAKSAATFAQFSRDGRWLAAGDAKGSVCLWEIEHGKWFAKQVKPATPKKLPSGEAPRLALVSTSKSPEIQNLQTLAEAKLSTEAAVQVVDRRDIDRILSEHKLTSAGFVQEEQVVKVGKLLGVNLFAVLETAPKSEAIGLVVYDAATGIRIWDAPVPEGNLNVMTAGVSQAVASATEKYAKIGKGLKTVCVSAVRNVGLPRSKESVCDTIAFFLERGFVSSRSLALLERARLDQVIRERDLKTDTPAEGLLASLVRVELEIGPGKDGKGIGATALLFDSRGKQVGKTSVNVEAENAVDVAGALQAKVLKLLEATPATQAPDRAKEAIRFVREAEFWRFYGNRERTIRAQEAAVALDPDNRESHAKLIWHYSQTASGMLMVGGKKTPPDDTILRSLELMRRATQEVLRFDAAWYKNPPKDADEPPEHFSARPYIASINSLAKTNDPKVKGLIEDIEQNSAQWTDIRLEPMLAKVRDRESFMSVLVQLTGRHPLAVQNIDHLPTTASAVWKKHLTRFLGLAEEYAKPPLHQDQVAKLYSVIRAGVHADVAPALVQRYRDKLRASKDPYVTVYDGLMEYHLQSGKKSRREDRFKHLADFRLVLQGVLSSDQARKSPYLRWHCYHVFASLFHTDQTLFERYADPAGKELCALADLMIEKKDIQVALASLVTEGYVVKPFRTNLNQASEYNTRLLQLLDSKKYQLLRKDPKSDAFDKNTLKASLTANAKRILSLTPAALERTTPWTKLDTLMDVYGSRKGIVRLSLPIAHDKAVYVVLFGEEKGSSNRFMQLCRFALPTGQQTMLGKIDLDTGYNPGKTQEYNRYRKGFPNIIADGLIHDGRYYAGTRDKGIIIFPLDGGAVQRLHTGNGLPADHVQSLTCVGGTLFAGLGEKNKPFFIVSHDLKRGETKILAANSRVEMQSPFDASTTHFRVVHFQADAPRQRVLAFVRGGTGSKVGLDGLWEIDAKEGRFRQFAALQGFFWMSPAFGGKLLLATTQTTLFDLKSDQAQAMKRLKSGPGGPKLDSVEYSQDAIRDVLKAGLPLQQVCTCHFVHDGWLWTASDFGRLSLDGQQTERFTSPRTKSRFPFHAYECLQMVDSNHVLIADPFGMWLATLPDGRK